jgi:hypothetical protein
MSTIDSVGKVAYIYNQPEDKWYPVAGYASTTVPYSWSGVHAFTNSVSFDSVVNAKAGVNNFLNPNSRNLAIPSPINGLVVFIQQTDEGQVLNQIQYYHLGAWRIYGDNAQLSSKTTSFTLSLADSGRTIDAESSTSISVTIPLHSSVPFLVGTQIAFIQTGAGQLVFVPDSGVTLLSKNSNKKIAARYSPATLIQKSLNTWVLIGDLTA